MPEPHIRFSIQLGFYPEKNDRCFAIALDPFLIRELRESIDFSAPGNDVYTRMLCSSERMVKIKIRDRNAFAKKVSEQITNEILKALGSNDTENGYSKLEILRG